MRITLENRTYEDLMPYLKLAARSIHAVHRKVHVRVKYGRNGHWHGRAWYGVVAMFIPRREHFRTFSRAERFGQSMPSEAKTYEELIVGLAAHEFAHQMRNGFKGRSVVKERFAEKKWMEAVEFYRTAEGQAFIKSFTDKRTARAQDRAQRVAAKIAERSSSDFKREQLLAARKRWQTKLKRATTALKKIERRLKRMDANQDQQ